MIYAEGRELRCQKTSCQVWNSESAEWRGGVFADRPLVRPDKPQPRPSDVCVSSLMKKFWYLGETLLSAEQTASSLPSALLDSHTTIRHPIRPLASSRLHLVEVLEVEHRHKTLVNLTNKIQLPTDG